MSPQPPPGLAGLRTGFGFDIEGLEAGAQFMLGGALFDQPRGLVGSGDGDAVCRALLDALLSAVSLPDIDTIFPRDDPAWQNEGSYVLLSQTATALYRVKLGAILNVSIRVVAEGLDLAADSHRMQSLLAEALSIEPGQVGITFGGAAGFDSVGRGEALIAFASLLCVLKDAALVGLKQPRGGLGGSQASEAFKQDLPGLVQELTEEELRQMPERVQKFERAVKSGVPPLPKAARPKEGSTLIVYTDGACRGNPGQSSTSFVVLNEMGELVHEEGRVIGMATNNQAEYEALIDALKWLQKNLGTDFRLQLRTDSELMARQVAGEWKIKDEGLKLKVLTAMNILLEFTSFEIKNVPREQNKRADAIANMALDG